MTGRAVDLQKCRKGRIELPDQRSIEA